MAVYHRALFTWFVVLIFLILLVLRLDDQIRWSYFIVFIPMWLYDSILFLYLVFNMMTHCKNGHDGTPMRVSMRRKIWYLNGLEMKLAFQIMLCLKLDNEAKRESSSYVEDFIPLYYLMIPLWILLPATVIDLLVILCTSEYRNYHNYQSYGGTGAGSRWQDQM